MKRFTETEIWKDSWFRKLPIKYKLFWFYLLNNCDNSGVWKQDIDLASFQIGSEINLEEAINLFNSGKERIKPINNNEYILIYAFILFQVGNIYGNNLTNLQKNSKDTMLKHIESKGLKEEDFNMSTGSLRVVDEYRYKGNSKGIGMEDKDNTEEFSFFELWKEIQPNFNINKTRKDNQHKIIETIKSTPFLIGQNDRGWKADIDWILTNSNNYIKVLEGKYLGSTKQASNQSTLPPELLERMKEDGTM